eukprot:CAMPEP_0113682118 /NCGR_PEP_ID=MMETSP0038_2-20120614/12443_1 /TAXON_ID=2898 /ORGANISM="Cryptomonas paramecium" /LENGTH=150 /DNA_ID=CAMNT_0000601067 /DNA_START=77 /DNA_END=525 /DNA_ORIENTATION=+ /assembly_acc=CAM_ASM_000170
MYMERKMQPPVSKPSYKCIWNDTKSTGVPPKDLSGLNPNISAGIQRASKYIVLNEPRSGSSWLQEISMMHPGVMVQFELDYLAGDAALSCQQCLRKAPDSKHPSRLPRKLFPPLACGMTMFGGNNQFSDVSSLAARHNASLVIVLRRDHL